MALPTGVTWSGTPTALYNYLGTGHGYHSGPGWYASLTSGESGGPNYGAPLSGGGFGVVWPYMNRGYDSTVDGSVSGVGMNDILPIISSGWKLAKLDDNGVVTAMGFYDTTAADQAGTNTDFQAVNLSMAMHDAGNNKALLMWVEGSTWPNYHLYSHVVDFSGATPTMGPRLDGGAVTDGYQCLGSGMLMNGAVVAIFGSNYNDGTSHRNITLRAVNPTTGVLIAEQVLLNMSVVAGAPRGWGLDYRTGQLVFHNLDQTTHQMTEYAVTFDGTAFTVTPGDSIDMTGITYLDWAGGAWAANGYDIGVSTTFHSTIAGRADLVTDESAAVSSWDYSPTPGSLTKDISLVVVEVKNWNISSGQPGGYNAATVWRILAANWVTRETGWVEFTAPFPSDQLTNLNSESIDQNLIPQVYSPYRNSSLFLGESFWKPATDSYGQSYTGYAVVLRGAYDSGPPPDAPSPTYATFPSSTRTLTSARLSMRSVVEAAPIESVLNETPGHVGLVLPSPTAVTGMSVYPGEAITLAPSDGAITTFGPTTDPGLVQTYRGFPRRPLVSVTADTLASTSGDFLSGNRDAPQDVDLGTGARWLAADWAAGVGSLVGTDLPWSLTGTATHIAYTYRRGKEIFSMDAMSIDPGQAIVGSFPLSESTGLTVSMVAVLRAPLGYTVFSNNQAELKANNAWVLNYLGGQTTSSSKIEVTKPTPLFITVVLSPPLATVYVSTGPGRTLSFASRAKTGGVVSTDFKLGQLGANPSVANMEILEVSLDTYARTKVQVEQLNAVYGSIYGQG